MQEHRRKKIEAGESKHDVYNYSWRKKNPAKYLLISAKSRAKKRGLEFDITEEDIVIPDVCPVLGIPLFVEIKSEQRMNPNCPSLDRIDSSKGYVKGNVQVMSWRANSLKRDGTPEEFMKIARFMNA